MTKAANTLTEWLLTQSTVHGFHRAQGMSFEGATAARQRDGVVYG